MNVDDLEPRDHDEEEANRRLLEEGDDGACCDAHPDHPDHDHEEPAPAPAPTVLRIAQHSRQPCPGPPIHGCTDRFHPLAIQIVNGGADPIAVSLVQGATMVAVSVVG